ncbi:MAG: YD repeat protein, partial [Desulfotomaculum sp. 46_296]
FLLLPPIFLLSYQAIIAARGNALLSVSLRGQSQYATSWYFQGNRSVESLTIPTTGIFKKGSWTTELTYKPTSPPSASQIKTLWRVKIDSNNYYLLTVETNGAIKLTVCRNSTQYCISTTSNYVTTGGTYSIMAAGNGSVIRLCINGSQIGSDVSYTEPIGNLLNQMSLGCCQDGSSYTAQADGLIDDVRFSNCARTSAQHQTAYLSNQPLPIDSNTTFKEEFDGNLQGLANGQGGTGIESYWNYTDFDLGGGWTASINTYNLNLVLQKDLFTIPGRGLPLQDTITYNSTAEGTGWQSPSDTRLSELQNGNVIFTDTDGSSHTFTYNSGNYTSPPGIYLTLHKDGPGNFTITDKQRNTYIYQDFKPYQYKERRTAFLLRNGKNR